MYDRTWKILQRIGLDKELQKHLDVIQDQTPRIAWKHKIAENVDECINIYDYYREGGMPSFHSYRFHLKRRFLSYKETEDNVVLNFADGITAECDLLVGADGYLTNYYSEKHDIHRGSDPEKYGTTYDGEVVVHVPKQHVLNQFEGWAPEATALLQLLPDSCRQWPLQYLKTLEDFGRGRVVFLGDAAHPTTPHQGSGAGQAIEDSYILARLIEKMRPQVGNAMVQGSTESGRNTERDYRGLNLSDPEVLEKVKDEFVEQFAKDYMWHTLYPLESYTEKSVEML
ncbi:hypothetical protein BDQ17DRAFT_1377379 [Cyathus striatus]|nr:hypothetical protein BDQ17DRAFT_1377379 [Cyathus striatus]